MIFVFRLMMRSDRLLRAKKSASLISRSEQMHKYYKFDGAYDVKVLCTFKSLPDSVRSQFPKHT